MTLDTEPVAFPQVILDLPEDRQAAAKHLFILGALSHGKQVNNRTERSMGAVDFLHLNMRITSEFHNLKV